VAAIFKAPTLRGERWTPENLNPDFSTA